MTCFYTRSEFSRIKNKGPLLKPTTDNQAKRFAQAYPVVLLARREDSFRDLVAEINGAGGRALGIPTDTSDPASVASAFRTIAAGDLADYKLAAAVYNVGAGRSMRPFLEMSLEDLDGSLRGNA